MKEVCMTDKHKDGWAGKTPPTADIAQTLRQYARDMRNNPTRAERTLWQVLKGRQRQGYKFRRQHVIDVYIADFYCAEARLVIEVDGDVHKGREVQDDNREAELERLGLRVLRFSNAAVINEFTQVVEEIDAALRSAS